MGGIRDLAAGSILGRYELVLRIASGGMGEVWAARLHGSRGFQKLVAIKTLLPELSQDPNFEQMFLDEASLTAKIKHPNVVEVIDLGDEDQILYQAMEWVEGASLWAVMRAAAKRRLRLPLIVAASIIRQAAAGLHAAHELQDVDGNPLGLVHRDVSPQNVLITPQGVAKIVDFGVARFTGRSSMVTQAGELRGKVPYMAPEAILGQPIDRRADVFALGLMLYQIVSGTHPFLGESDTITLSRIVEPRPPRPLIELVPSVPAALSDLVGRALRKSPADRIATAALLMRELERAVPGAGSEDGREAVAAFCNELGPDHFPARVRELREALRRLDAPIDTRGLRLEKLGYAPEPPDRISSLPSRASLHSYDGISSSPNVQVPSEPSLIPTRTPPGIASPVRDATPPAGSTLRPLDEALPTSEAPIDMRPGRRVWMAIGGAVVLAAGLVAAFSFGGSRARGNDVGAHRQTPSAAAETPSAVMTATQPVTTSAPTQAATAPPAASTSAPVVLAAPVLSARPVGSARAPKPDKPDQPKKPDKPPETAGEFKPGGI